MRLVLREYLALQKESGEIDALLPDLLLSMGLKPLNRAGRGSRQLGVDLPAVGVDPRDGVRKLVLITAKQGDINRTTWNGGLPADVKPSLDEIKDIYLRSHVEPAHHGLPVLIVLATGGDMDEQVRTDWAAYTGNYTGTVNRGGVDYDVQFEFWGGDELADFIEKYLVDEYLFPSKNPKDAAEIDLRAVMRYTLALAGGPDFDLGPYEAFVRATLDPDRLTDVDKRRRALRSLRLTLRVLYRWGEREGNLRPALLAAEYVVLRVWHFMTTQKLTGRRRAERAELGRLYETWREVLYAYSEALRPHCEAEHGLFGYSPAEDVEYPIRVFDVLGHLALAGLDEYNMAVYAGSALAQPAADRADAADDDSTAEDSLDSDSSGVGPDSGSSDDDADPAFRLQAHLGNVSAIANRAIAVISKNPAAMTPPFDDNVVEIVLVLVLLTAAGRADAARAWVEELTNRMGFAHTHARERVPTYAGTYEDRVDVVLGVEPPELPSSTILTVLAEWAVVLNDPALYDAVRRTVLRQMSRINLQAWIPTDETDPALYAGPAIDTGNMRTGIVLPETVGEFAARVRAESRLDDEVPAYSADGYGLPVLSLVASRRFRTPPRPSSWRGLFPDLGGAVGDPDGASPNG